MHICIIKPLGRQDHRGMLNFAKARPHVVVVRIQGSLGLVKPTSSEHNLQLQP